MTTAPSGREPDGPPLDVKRIVTSLDEDRVSYLLVGRLGASLYGAERVTKDIDVLPRTDAENLDRLAAAPCELGAFLRSGDSATTRPERCPW